MLEQDCKVPEHCWNDGICKDICEAQTEVLMGMFSVDLLSDTEFLMYKLPKTGRGMTYNKANLYIYLIGGAYWWGGLWQVCLWRSIHTPIKIGQGQDL